VFHSKYICTFAKDIDEFATIAPPSSTFNVVFSLFQRNLPHRFGVVCFHKATLPFESRNPLFLVGLLFTSTQETTSHLFSPRIPHRTQYPINRKRMADTFHGFACLPQELREMIWEFHLNNERVVTINHCQLFENESLRSDVFQESFPALLHVCHESRQLALPRYTSVFPQPGSQSWTYTGSRRSSSLRKRLGELGLPRRGGVTTMIKVITTHMNEHPLEWGRYTQFANGLKVGRYPLWFDAQRDILLFKPKLLGDRDAYFSLHLTSPEQSNVMDKIRYLVVDLDSFHNTGRLAVYDKNWASVIRRELRGDITMPALQQLTFLMRGTCEVYRFSFDTSGSLKNNEWTFALDLASEEFQDVMKESWSNVTWDITVNRTNETTDLWQAAFFWCWLAKPWRSIKRVATTGVSEVDQTW
jgi:hypothetical protein